MHWVCFTTSENVKHITTNHIKTLDLLISCEQDISFSYYDDDGWSNEFEKGSFAMTEINVTSGEQKEISFHKPSKDDFKIVVSCERFDLIGMEI